MHLTYISKLSCIGHVIFTSILMQQCTIQQDIERKRRKGGDWFVDASLFTQLLYILGEGKMLLEYIDMTMIHSQSESRFYCDFDEVRYIDVC